MMEHCNGIIVERPNKHQITISFEYSALELMYQFGDANMPHLGRDAEQSMAHILGFADDMDDTNDNDELGKMDIGQAVKIAVAYRDLVQQPSVDWYSGWMLCLQKNDSSQVMDVIHAFEQGLFKKRPMRRLITFTQADFMDSVNLFNLQQSTVH